MVDMSLSPTKPNTRYLIYKYKDDLALNNLQWLICHKTQPNKKFCNYLVHASLQLIYHMTEAVQTVEDTHFGFLWYCSIWCAGMYALLLCMCDLKAAQMNAIKV